VGIGTSSPSAPLHVRKDQAAATYIMADNVGTVGASTSYGFACAENGAVSSFFRSLRDATGEAQLYNSLNAALRFGTNNTERARITSGGFFKASNSGSYAGVTGTYHEIVTNITDNQTLVVTNSAASPYGQFINFSGATPNNTTNWFFICSDSTNSKAIIYSNGSFESRANSYGGISDVKLKQDIVDAGSQWDDIKGLRVRKFRMKDEVAADPNYPAHLGLIAQEAELVSPGLVFESPDTEKVTRTREVEKTREVEVTPAVLDEDGNVVEPAVMETETYTEEEEYTETVDLGTTTKSVKYSILYMKAVKALQEAMERIETLEAKVSALEGN
jgi:hypothetical protein